MSAASFLGIAGIKGYDGLIYSVGWPIVMFLIAEPLRNLGKYTFSDVVAYRLKQRPVRAAAAIGSLVTVLFYLIAQMVGAGTLFKLMFNLPFEGALVLVGALMISYVLFGGRLATTWVQIIKAVLLLGGATLLVVMVGSRFNFSYGNLFGEAAKLYTNPLDTFSLGLAFKGQNVAFMVGLAFAVAASANFPALLMSILWKRFTTAGAVASIYTGLTVAVVMIVLSPTVWVDIFHMAAPIVKYKNPGLFSMGGAFLVGILVSLLSLEPAAEAKFEDEKLRAYVGIGAE